jgi:hypothetical protein
LRYALWRNSDLASPIELLVFSIDDSPSGTMLLIKYRLESCPAEAAFERAFRKRITVSRYGVSHRPITVLREIDYETPSGSRVEVVAIDCGIRLRNVAPAVFKERTARPGIGRDKG